MSRAPAAPISRDPAIKRQFWDRGDLYDDNDPRAPVVPRCGGCDGLVFDGVCEPCDRRFDGIEAMSVAEKVKAFTPGMGFQREDSTGLIHMDDAA